MTNNYNLLIQKLDTFIRKYYLNKFVRGLLFSVALVFGLFLAFTVLEHYFYFGQNVRKMFFFAFLLSSIAGVSYWVINPLVRYFNLGKNLSHHKAAEIIGSHFPDVKDKLINILQLKSQSSLASNSALIEASINQKTEKIKLIPFKSAIDISKNKQYLKYALPPFMLLLVILFAAPSIIKDSTHRIINNNKDFEREAPFSFLMSQEDLSVIQFEDYVLNVTTEGSLIPEDIFIELDNFQYRLQKTDNNTFQYIFKNVQKDTKFNLFSGFVKSIPSTLKVLKKPNLINFSLSLDYPRYTGIPDETLDNVGDISVPQGTKVVWNFDSENTDLLQMHFSGAKDKVEAKRKGKSSFDFFKRIMRNESYRVFISNQAIPNADSISFAINVSPDKRPEINVEIFEDSTQTDMKYFAGSASDDYGISSLTFNYTQTDASGRSQGMKTLPLTIQKGREVNYDHAFDITALQLSPGDKLSYYFEVFDNDGVNGIKSAKTSVMTLEKPTIEEFEEKEDENEEEIKDELEEVMKESKEIRDELKEMREKLLQKPDIDWQDKNDLEKLLERQKELEEKIKDAQEKFNENLENQEEFSEQKEEILKKQEKLQEMFNEVLDPETQELMRKIEEMLEEMNKDEMMEMMEDVEMDDETMEKELDRLLELFKQLELEKELEEQIEKLEELAEEQEDLAKETEEQSKPESELEKEQEKINEEFEEIKEELEDLEKQNEELEFPKEMGDDNEEKMEDIQEDLDDSKEKLEKKESKGASESQKKAAGKMKEMAGNLQSSMESGEMEQMEEDMQALRQLLDNLIALSFDQEDLIDDIRITDIIAPRYLKLTETQFKLRDDFSLIEDSLQALSKRVEQLETYVIEKVGEINTSFKGSIEELTKIDTLVKRDISRLEERLKDDAEVYQRSTMKNVNDLALMLDDAMQQMQAQMASMMPGNQMCDKPGGSGKGKGGDKPSDKISEGQEGLKEQLGKMKEQMKAGGKKGMAKQFAEAAAKQAQMRKALEKMQKEKGEQGKGSKELQEIIDAMDKSEEDLVNKRLDNQLMKRQEEIVTRLLEAEQAQRQREKDNKRKAEVGEDKKKEMPAALKEYLKKREAEVEMFKNVSPALKQYYRNLVNDYYKALKSD